ncbi:hypothetical protein [Streptomyces sp. JB150]|uniref:hypothetical protein n=1 Tax=Streptomyces sp. JB150 TaxID=2714844 RepID=UPI001F11082E|nr:hypothetical protein [Streptomyces sp. JB150]
MKRSLPDGLTRRARSFLGAHAVHVDAGSSREKRQRYLDRGVPAAVVDRMTAFHERWGGLVLPPAPLYDGGPLPLSAHSPEERAPGDWWFEAGSPRTALPYSFMVGPGGEFGIDGERWTPLHAGVEGWVESVALHHHASREARRITRVVGEDVERVDLDGYEPVREVRGLADTWWRGTDTLVAVHRGEADCLGFPRGRTAWIYAGLDWWGLRGGLDDDEVV